MFFFIYYYIIIVFFFFRLLLMSYTDINVILRTSSCHQRILRNLLIIFFLFCILFHFHVFCVIILSFALWIYKPRTQSFPSTVVFRFHLQRAIYSQLNELNDIVIMIIKKLIYNFCIGKCFCVFFVFIFWRDGSIGVVLELCYILY